MKGLLYRIDVTGRLNGFVGTQEEISKINNKSLRNHSARIAATMLPIIKA